MRALIVALLLTVAAQAGAAEVVMVCDADNYEKRYYKLVKPVFGDNTVKQKIDGQWVNWCKKYCKEIEVYASGAMQVHGREVSWDKDYPKEEIQANRKYYRKIIYWLDFEFGQRKVQARLFKDKGKRQELKKYASSNTYNCKINESDGYLKKFKGTIEGVIQ